MKPSFALNLSHDGIGLFARRGAGWELLGEVALDAPDLTERLGQLRQRAQVRAQGALTTKLIIPASQILYLEVDAPGPRPTMRRKQIAEALEGATPYAVDDLVFDWSGRGDRVKVAVVARETLTEAEGFAEDWGFAPVSFVAAPERGAFGGEPWFGAAAAAETHLPEGEKIERDQDPVPIFDAPLAAADDATVSEEAETEQVVAPDPEADAATAEDIADMAFLPDVRAVEALPEDGAPHDETASAPPEPEATIDDSAAEAQPADEAPPAEEPAIEAELDALFAAEAAQVTPPSPEEAPEPEPVAAPEVAPEAQEVETEPAEESATVLDVAPEAPKSDDKPAKVAATAEAMPSLAKLEKAVAALRSDGTPRAALSMIDDLAGDEAEPAAAFTTRRSSTLSASDPLPGAARRLGGAARLHPTIAPERRAQYITSGEAGVTAPGLALPESESAETEAPVERADRKNRSGLGKAARSTVALGGSAGRALAQSLRPATTSGASKPTPLEPSVFGAPRGKVVGGKPKHLGAMLVGGLVGLMAVVALWSSFLNGPEPAPLPATETQTPEAAPSTPETDTGATPAPSEDTATPAPSDPDTAETPADTVDVPSPDEESVADTPAGDATAPLPEDQAAIEPAAPDATTDTTTQSTFSSQSAPSIGATEPSPSDSALASPDPALQQPAGLALAPVAPSADSVPTAPVPPPPFDELARVNPDGNYEPTVQGVVTPGGYTLYAGRPDHVPGDRPDAVIRAATAAAAPPPAETAAPATPEPYADPALSKFRPRLRPASVEKAAAAAKAAEPAPAAPVATPDDGALLGPDLSPAERKRLAALRPVARPKAVLALAATAVPAPVEETPAATTFADATDLAVTVSRRPPGRPRDFSGSVDKALAAALAAEAAAQPAPAPAPAPQVKVASAAPAPQATPAPQNAPAPAVELDEPEPVGPLKNLPTSASVAKQATQKNVLDLGSINLIGVYGSSKDRRALVRMPNGRFVKVSVGDRLDGGKVTAIGDGQLTYQKGTRPVTLKLLKGG